MPAKLTQGQQDELRALVRDSLTFAVRATLLLVNKNATKPHADYLTAVDDVLGQCNRLADQLAAWGVRDTNPSVVAKLWAGGSYSDGGPGGSPYDVTNATYADPGAYADPEPNVDPETGEVLNAPKPLLDFAALNPDVAAQLAQSAPVGNNEQPYSDSEAVPGNAQHYAMAREELDDAAEALIAVLSGYTDPVSLSLRRFIDAFNQYVEVE